MTSTTTVLGVVLATALGGGSAFAQTVKPQAGADVSTPALGEVVVTARKRSERLIEVPISIQAFTSTEIKSAGIDDINTLKDRAAFTVLPQTTTGAGGRAQGNIVFRGLQAVSGAGVQQNSGSLFIDGIYVSGAPQSVNTADVERIEVLKGPQNAYFGRSTFGGAINFITHTPSDTFQGDINSRVTARGSVDADGTVEGPLIKGLLDGRITVFDHNKVAQYHASDGGDLGAEQTRGLSATLYFTPTPKLWVKLRGTYQVDEDSSADQAYLPARLYGGTSCTGKSFTGTDANGAPASYTLTQAYFCNGIPTQSQLGSGVIDASTNIPANFINVLKNNTLGIRFLSATPQLNHSGLIRDIMRGSAQSEYKFDNGFSLNASVGFNDSKATYAFDIDHSSLNYFFNAFANIDFDLTADLRLVSDQSKRIRGLVGVSYFTSRNQTDRADDNLVFGLPPSESNFADNRNNTPSAYGSIDFDILSSLTATFEGRYESEEDYAFDIKNAKYKQHFNSFLPRAILKYHPTRNIDAYVSYSEGAQPSILNSGFIAANTAQRAYISSVSPGQSIFAPQPKLRSYEIGFKQRAFDGRVEYAVTGYQMFWDNALVTAFLNNPPACNLAGISLTAACPLALNGTGLQLPNNARLRGVEFEGSAHPTNDLDFNVTLDWKDPIWTRYYNTGLDPFAGTVSHFNGNAIARIPLWSGTFSGSYHRRLSETWTAFARGDVLYTGKAWDTDLNIVKTDDYFRVNARLGIQRQDMTLELFATNLLNDKHWDYVSKVADVTELTFAKQGVLVQPAQVREIGVRIQYKFQ